MKKTDNYGLALFEKTDNMSISAEENSLNANMKIIDNALKEKASINDMTDYIEEHKEELKGKDGYTPVKGVDYFDGKDYVLTDSDKEDISKLVEVNIPTKISELENDKNYLSSIPNEYVTENDLSEKSYATESFVTNKIAEAELSGSEVDLSGLATKDELASKVDKVKGKSLVDDTEIERLKTVTNYDDTTLKNQINSKADKTDIPTVPTNISSFTNDSGYLTKVPSEYVTETELNNKGYLTEHQDLSSYAKTTDIPTKVSELDNDKNYLTSIPSEYITETELNNKKYLTSVPSDYKTKTENDSLYQAKGNYLTNYTETDPTVPSHVKSIKTTDISNWNSKSTFSGNYNDLTNKPTIPTVPSNISAFNNDMGYLTEITEEIKAEIVRDVIESFGGNPVFGYVDKNNNIIVSGNLPDGDYTVMYEMEEGETITIGNLVLDNTVDYSIKNNLTNCTNSNSATTIVEGESYSATITANSGYELKSLSVTMGDSPVSVSGGNINIASVTGNIVITAVAEEIQNEPENVLETVGYKTNTRIRSSTGEEQTMSGVEATNYIPITYGQTISLQNIKVESSGNNSVAVYNSSKQYISGVYLSNFISGVKINGSAINGELVSQKLDSSKFIHDTTPISASSGIAFIRFSANEITENSIVKVED